MAQINLTEQAQADLIEISLFYQRLSGTDSAKRKLAAIRQGLFKIVNNPLLGRREEGLPPEISFWLVSKNEFRVYFIRTGPETIDVLRIWPTRRQSLSPEEVVPEN